MSTATQRLLPTDAPGSVTRAPRLPAGFTDTFTSYLVDIGGARLHAVVGGDGPPLLLVPGWPENWFAWREMMPALARRFTVVAADPRGVNLSDRTAGGYDAGNLAADLVKLMEALGHARFAMTGHDLGMTIGYALAADHPERLARLVVAEATIPGISPFPPPWGPARVNDMLWHFAFNRLTDLNETLVRGREHVFFGWQFATKASTPAAVPGYAVDYYVEAITRDPEALHCGTFDFYRAIERTVEQNIRRQERRLRLPVLAIGGADGLGERVADTMRLVADDVTPVVLERCGHYVADEAPEGMLEALEPFLAPYAAGG
ncbi:MAG TPA: alpha/beta hydrolase [Streptosporangiaceae bacterium]|nr:alpha/beta hydrolase [Streptosporangiaceae bacterium]